MKPFRYGDRVRIKPEVFNRIAIADTEYWEGMTSDMVGTLDVPKTPGVWRWMVDFDNGKRFGFEEYELEHAVAVQDGE